ncbi:hypothetical protein GCM10008955_15130 [Deinococcus malanensis]|uniref:Uncharacterized protein n=1 Tax=Deinococcus malanensis TaxID=1706855 RepID=A0ABQ2EUH1_9DEIO|nr:hypothetical protein [Deinococcus malanensis]GGK22613.1 hypothetical protein GCM10008955_15130 [Deinococcus malanensis]
MRAEFDPTLNGGLDKLNRYHREAATEAALRAGTVRQTISLSVRVRAAVRQIRQLLHLPVAAAPTMDNSG